MVHLYATSTMTWSIHWLEATGDLRPWRDTITAEVDVARQAIADMMPMPPLDILVQRIAGAVIPEIGMVGHAYRAGLFALTLDPDNPSFEAALKDGALHRQVAHEAHHCMRMAGRGYGQTLGEALVSEGLAGRFAEHLFGTPPEPWERAVTPDVLKAHLPDADGLARKDYGHPAWFFGAGDRYPRWLGYTLGYEIVGDWLAETSGITSDVWVNVPAKEVLAAARGRTLPAG
jgi:hypothetical protein